MADINSKSSLDALKELKDKDPAFAGRASASRSCSPRRRR
jgi:hypothetical protein